MFSHQEMTARDHIPGRRRLTHRKKSREFLHRLLDTKQVAGYNRFSVEMKGGETVIGKIKDFLDCAVSLLTILVLLRELGKSKRKRKTKKS